MEYEKRSLYISQVRLQFESYLSRFAVLLSATYVSNECYSFLRYIFLYEMVFC